MELYIYSIICPDGTLSNEAGATLNITIQILYWFEIKRLLPTAISHEKRNGYFMDWQILTFKMNVKCGLTE
jgi:hypothetical protein